MKFIAWLRRPAYGYGYTPLAIVFGLVLFAVTFAIRLRHPIPVIDNWFTWMESLFRG